MKWIIASNVIRIIHVQEANNVLPEDANALQVNHIKIMQVTVFHVYQALATQGKNVLLMVVFQSIVKKVSIVLFMKNVSSVSTQAIAKILMLVAMKITSAVAVKVL